MLTINDLIVAFETETGELTAVKGVSLSLAPGETLALVGESGCGKTVLCKSMLKILCERGNIKQGEILLEGKDLVPLHEKEMIPYRGSEIAMVFQDPMTSLDPTMPVGRQIAEVIELAELRKLKAAEAEKVSELKTAEAEQVEIAHAETEAELKGPAEGCKSSNEPVGYNGPAGCKRCMLGAANALSADREADSTETDRRVIRETAPQQAREKNHIKEAAKQQAIELMRLVEIDNPELRYDQMPHHFSGGMRQRIAIAIALAGRPKLLLADEPTTALDQETQAQILALLKKIDTTTIFITHDLSLVEDVADRVAIMQAGEIVETGPVSEIFQHPQHTYTKKLLGYLDYGKGRGHNHKHEETVRGKHLVEIKNIKKYFPLGRKKVHKALDGFSMNIHRGEILGIVGPSGCGKSTLARCIMGMEKLTSGEIIFHNTDNGMPANRVAVPSVSASTDAAVSANCAETAGNAVQYVEGQSAVPENCSSTFSSERQMPLSTCSLQPSFRTKDNWKQMIFQDSDSAFNPRMTIGDIIAEPMKIALKQQKTKGLFQRKPAGSQPFEESTCQFCNAWHEKMSMRDRVIELMKQVELDPALIDRHPYEVSGGQRQRAAIARAISVDPDLIIADEPISSLDISTQAQIVHLFRKLQEERNLTILFIAHDLPMVNHISDRIIEMN